MSMRWAIHVAAWISAVMLFACGDSAGDGGPGDSGGLGQEGESSECYYLQCGSFGSGCECSGPGQGCVLLEGDFCTRDCMADEDCPTLEGYGPPVCVPGDPGYCALRCVAGADDACPQAFVCREWDGAKPGEPFCG